jgi:hypothetical protein
MVELQNDPSVHIKSLVDCTNSSPVKAVDRTYKTDIGVPTRLLNHGLRVKN